MENLVSINKYTAFFLLLFCSLLGVSQDEKNKLIQFSGVVVASDSLAPVPYASIIIKGQNRGTVTDYFGYYSFVAQRKDTLEFSAIGYTSAFFVVPDTLTSSTYSLIQTLHSDTVLLEMVEIYPWPSKEQFKNAFLNLKLSSADYINATNNLKQTTLNSQMTNMATTAALSHKYGTLQAQSQLYYAGQYPPNNLLNPIAWAKFIRSWKKGKLKSKNQ